MNPTRARLLDILIQMGLRISVTQLEEIHGELVGTLQVEGGRLKGATIAGSDTAALIDEIPVLAAIAPYTEAGNRSPGREGTTGERVRPHRIDSHQSSRHGRAGGGTRRWLENSRWTIASRRGTRFIWRSSHRHGFQHRSLRAQGETLIRGSECAAISYPEFFSTLEELGRALMLSRAFQASIYHPSLVTFAR